MLRVPISFRRPLILVVEPWAEEFSIGEQQAELIIEGEAATIDAIDFDGERLFLYLSPGSTCRVLIDGEQASIGMHAPVPSVR